MGACSALSAAGVNLLDTRSPLNDNSPGAAQKKPIFEFSFGQGKMFISDSNREEVRNKTRVVLPTDAALFLGEYFFNDSWSMFLSFNLPVSSQQFLIDGKPVQEKASPFLGAGPVYSLLHLDLYGRLVMEPQFGILAGTVFNQSSGVFPAVVTAGRLHISTPTGFTMYIGLAYTVGVEAVMLLYGVGHRF